jgi:hypothetical protein
MRRKQMSRKAAEQGARFPLKIGKLAPQGHRLLRVVSLGFSRQGAHRPYQSRNFSAPLNGLSSVATMFVGVPVTLRRSWGRSSVHPASAVLHRGRLAQAPAPRLGSASEALVHGQTALHGVVSLVWSRPHPNRFTHLPIEARKLVIRGSVFCGFGWFYRSTPSATPCATRFD